MASPLAAALMLDRQPVPTPPQATINPTNVAGIYANNDAQKMDQYKAQLAQQNSMFGGLASLGSAGIGALGKSGLLSGLGAGAGAGADISAGALAGLEALGPLAII